MTAKRDLLVIVPSRGRPERLAIMIDACLDLAEMNTRIAVGIDLDDPARWEYDALRARAQVFTGERQSLSGWTNMLARALGGSYGAIASFGDDHLARTPGWDRLLLEALATPGIAYGDDKHQGERLPTAPVISSEIVEALGWMCEPSLRHFCVDTVLKDLGTATGCLRYVPEVVIEHMHPHGGKAQTDQTYLDAGEHGEGWVRDWEAYGAWKRERMAADVAKVRPVL